MPLTSKDAGIGRVIIPSDITRDSYIRKCVDSGRVSIYTFGAGVLRNISVCKHAMNDIEYPLLPEDFGSAVMYIKIPNREEYVIYGVLKEIGEAYDITENQFSIGKKSDVGISNITGDASKGSMTVRVNHSSNGGKLTISIGNSKSGGEVVIDVSGSVNFDSDKFNVLAYDEINFTVPKSGNSQVTSIKYIKGVGFSYSDEFGNTESIGSLHHSINHKKLVKLGSGVDNAVLYSQLKSFLTDILTEMAKTTVTVNNVPTPINNAALFVQLITKLQLDLIKSKYIQIQ